MVVRLRGVGYGPGASAGNDSGSVAAAEPLVIWVDFFDSVSYLIDQATDDRPIELMLLSFEALADPGLTDASARMAWPSKRAAS